MISLCLPSSEDLIDVTPQGSNTSQYYCKKCREIHTIYHLIPNIDRKDYSREINFNPRKECDTIDLNGNHCPSEGKNLIDDLLLCDQCYYNYINYMKGKKK